MSQAATSILTDAADADVIAANDNPFFSPWNTPFGIPPFEQIDDEHYLPAFQRGIDEMRSRTAAIVENPEPPTFANTIKAMEKISPLLDQVAKIFRNLTSTDTNDRLKALRVEIMPRLSREFDAILLDEQLFQRVHAVYSQRESLGLDLEDGRLLELTHRDFVRAGAALGKVGKARLTEINAALSETSTNFVQNLLAETKEFELVVEDEADLSGLTGDLLRSGKATAEAKGRPEAWIFGLDRSTYEAFMTHADNRRLRRCLQQGYIQRCARGNKADNRELILRMVRLRAERAELLGYSSHAHCSLEVTMTKTPERARELLQEIWQRGLARAGEELVEMQAIVDAEGGDFSIEAWDWWYYAEKLRQKKYDFDESQMQPYFKLENVRAGAFHVASELFGLTFERLEDVPRWSPRVESYRVLDRQGSELGIFMVDDYARAAKRDGAWMDTFRDSSHIDGEEIRPIVVNCMNLIEPKEDESILLRFDEVETLFHEFGHGLHGLMTRVRYERFSGTAGSPRDYVEFPSQFMEHYAVEPEVLAVYARHDQTGEVIPQELVTKLLEAATHNQGFKTMEYVAASLVDLAWHTLSAEEAAAITDVRQFEKKVLDEHGLLEQIEPRYRSPYFSHIFSAPSGYSAGYYAYLWSEVLDADGFAAFLDSGDIFQPELAERLAQHIYRAGQVAPGEELYRRFRGGDPGIEPLLRQRGFVR